jgi:hypothetical protein
VVTQPDIPAGPEATDPAAPPESDPPTPSDVDFSTSPSPDSRTQATPDDRVSDPAAPPIVPESQWSAPAFRADQSPAVPVEYSPPYAQSRQGQGQPAAESTPVDFPARSDSDALCVTAAEYDAPAEPVPGSSADDHPTAAWAATETGWATPEQEQHAQPREAAAWAEATWSSYPTVPSPGTHPAYGQPSNGQRYDGQRYDGQPPYGTQPQDQDGYAQDGYARAAEPYPAEHARPRRQVSLRLVLISAAAILGVAGLVASLAGVAVQLMPRRFTDSQQRQIMTWEISARWRTWQTGKIFPAAISYQIPSTVLSSSSGLKLTAHRLGIAPQATCQAALDAALADVLDLDGCQAVLRATYLDSSQSFVITVGVAVLRTQAPAAKRLPAGPDPSPGVQAVAFPGTLSSRFEDPQRQLTGAVTDGPYLIMYAAGYTDGRPRDAVTANPYADDEMLSVASGIATTVGRSIGAAPPLPKCPGAPGC